MGKRRARRSWEEAREGEAIERLARIKWPEGFKCPRCHHPSFDPLKWRGLWQCKRCRHQTSVTAGTILHRSRIPASKWVAAGQLLAKQFVRFTASELGEERQREGFLKVKPWTLTKQLQLRSFDTAVRILRLLEEAVRSMPLEAFGGSQRITFDDFLRALLRPRRQNGDR
jgi:ribosomal protein L37AE/L43A